MTTSMFRTIDPVTDERLIRDLGALLNLSPLARSVVASHLVPYLRLKTESERQKLDDLVLSEVGPSVQASDALGALRFLRHVAKTNFLKAKDPAPASTLISDLQNAGLVAEAQQNELTALIEKIGADVSPLRTEFAQKRAAGGVFPTIVGIGRTIEVRMVAQDSFDPNGSALPDKILGKVAIVSLRLDTDDDTSLVFQMSKDELGILIASLEKCAAELEAFERCLDDHGDRSGTTDTSSIG